MDLCIEENGMSCRVKTNYDHHERARTHNAYVYAVDNAFFIARSIWIVRFFLCVCVDRHIKLPSMCRIVWFINTHISFNIQVKLHLFSYSAAASIPKMHFRYRQTHTNCTIGSSRNICLKHLLQEIFSVGFFLRVVFGENLLLRLLSYSEL